MPALMDPPGELMYRLMSAALSSVWRKRIWATSRLLMSSSMGRPRNTMRSFRSRLKMSIARSSRPVFSITYGTRKLIGSPFGPGAAGAWSLVGGHLDQHLVQQAVRLGLLGAHVEVPLRVAGDPVHVLAGVLGQDLVHDLAVLEDFLGLNLDVGDLAAHHAGRLVHHDLGVRQ